MNQLTKLIEQWCSDDQDSARGFIELFNYDKKQAKSWTRFVEFLATRPTCGEEQRKFLDELENSYFDKTLLNGKCELVAYLNEKGRQVYDKYNNEYDPCERKIVDITLGIKADISKVIKGE